MVEQRSKPRHACLLPVQFAWEGRLLRATIVEVSVAGATVESPVQLAVGTLAALELRLGPDAPTLALSGEVVSVRPAMERICLGVRWVEARAEADARYLERALEVVLGEKLPIHAAPGKGVIWRPGMQPKAISRAGLRSKAVGPPCEGETETTERRRVGRRGCDMPLTLMVDRRPIRGRLRDAVEKGLYVETDDELPRMGAVVTCRYPAQPVAVRLVCFVVRVSAGGNEVTEPRGFALRVFRIERCRDSQTAPASPEARELDCDGGSLPPSLTPLTPPVRRKRTSRPRTRERLRPELTRPGFERETGSYDSFDEAEFASDELTSDEFTGS